MSNVKGESYRLVKHPDIKVIEVIWKGKFSGDNFREGSEAMLRELVVERFSKVILDLENTTFTVSEEDHRWFKEDFVPRAIRSNLKSIAFVQPGPFNTLSIANILFPYFPVAINFEIFNDFEAASKWIIKN